MAVLVSMTSAVNAVEPDIPDLPIGALLDRTVNQPFVPTRVMQAGERGIAITSDHSLVKETYPVRQMDAARVMNIDVAALRTDLDVAADAYSQGIGSKITLAVLGEPIEYSTVSTMGDSHGPFVAWAGKVELDGSIHNASATVYAGTVVIKLEHMPFDPSGGAAMTVEIVQPIRDQLPDARGSGVQASIAVKSTDFSGQIPESEPVISPEAVTSLTSEDDIASLSHQEHVIDVMVAYSTRSLTPEPLLPTETISEATLAANVIDELNKANAALVNTDLSNSVKLRLVQLVRYGYGGTSVSTDVLEALRAASDPELNKIVDERARTGADIVVFVDNNDLTSCGEAHPRKPSSVDTLETESYIVMGYRSLVQEAGCPAPYTLAHEFGHSFGIAHENAPVGFWRDYSRAILNNGGGYNFTSVTARYDSCCGRILQYSNPYLYFGPAPTGSSDRWGSLTIVDTAEYMAAFWPTRNDWIDVERVYTSHGQFYSLSSDGRVRPHEPIADNLPLYYGDASNKSLSSPIVGIATDPDGTGYWLVDAKGCIHNYSAQLYYSGGIYDLCSLTLNAPVVGIEEYKSPATGAKGYWMVAADGGIFAFGAAPFHGSMGGTTLNAPMVGMASVPGATGYWTVAEDGGIFAFGGAPFYGSLGGQTLNTLVTGMDTTTGAGYWLFKFDGTISAFGDKTIEVPHTGEAKTAGAARYNTGYWWLELDGDLSVCSIYSAFCKYVDPY